MSVTYSNYLKLDQLLAAQVPLSDGPEHDELLFIVIHQVYELWFKELLHEIDSLAARLDADDLAAVNATLKRVLTILKVQVAQIDILETMSPVSFLSFRSRLEAASGLPVAAIPRARIRARSPRRAHAPLPRRHAGARPARAPARRAEPLGPLPALPRPPRPRRAGGGARPRSRHLQPRVGGAPPDADRDLPFHPELAQVCERLVDLDEGIQEWRYRHVKMVERTIGTKPGTGGSAGAEYLKTTLFQPLFPDLWAIRAEL